VSPSELARSELRGCLVTGTDTGVGKTVLAAAITAALRSRGIDVVALKPVITGLDEPASAEWPHDHELLARAAGTTADRVTLERYGPPVSPHLAAELAGRPINRARLVAGIRSTAAEHELVVVEGVGGLLVPLADGFDVRDLARTLRLPVLVTARPGVGTINHTLLTLAAAKAAGLEVQAVVVTPWPPWPSDIERSNRATIAGRGGVPVEILPQIERPEPHALAAAAESLPLERWCAEWLGSGRWESSAGADARARADAPARGHAPALALTGSDRRPE
jgi:dethiobiotin synthetase